MNLPAGYTLVLEPASLPMEPIHALLATTFWAGQESRALHDVAFRNSLCVLVQGPFGSVAAFGRMVTDRATFGYLTDFVVAEGHRGLGLGRAMTRALLEHPDLQHGRRILLATPDAHGVYAACGFGPLPNPEWFMQIIPAPALSR